MKETYRFTPKSGGNFENDAEHSWNVAMLCMLLHGLLTREFGTDLNLERMLKMSLIHDLAEVLTGDTKTWDKDARVKKDEKERGAIEEILMTLPVELRIEFKELWLECEERSTIEAQIVKSIDRMEPVLHRVLLGYGWDNVNDGNNGTVDALNERQLPRHEFSSTLTELFKNIRDEGVERKMFKDFK